MKKEWKVDLNNLEIKHVNGFTMKKFASTSEKKEGWHVKNGWHIINGEEQKEKVQAAFEIYDHEYSKWMFNGFIDIYKMDKSEFIEIANEFIYQNNFKMELITLHQIDDYLNDKELFPIGLMSVIRSAVHLEIIRRRREKHQRQ